jgi:hypothetical protein
MFDRDKLSSLLSVERLKMFDWDKRPILLHLDYTEKFCPGQTL